MSPATIKEMVRAPMDQFAKMVHDLPHIERPLLVEELESRVKILEDIY